MCLIIDWIGGVKPPPKIAKRAIVCFKSLYDDGCSSNRKITYNIGVKAPIVQFGIHCYGNSFLVEEGYHSYNISNLNNPVTNNIFVIPKGTTHYDGFYNWDTTIPNRVSSTIIRMGRKDKLSTYIRLIKYLITKQS